jgi:hypothetical protein
MTEQPVYTPPAYTPPAVPGKVQAIAIITLVSGILNILYGIGFTLLGGTSFVVATIGIGLLCIPYFLLPIALGIFEVIYGARLMGNPARKFNVQTIAILEIVAIITGAVPSAVAGILNLVFYSDPPIKNYIDSLPA